MLTLLHKRKDSCDLTKRTARGSDRGPLATRQTFVFVVPATAVIRNFFIFCSPSPPHPQSCSLCHKHLVVTCALFQTSLTTRQRPGPHDQNTWTRIRSWYLSRQHTLSTLKSPTSALLTDELSTGRWRYQPQATTRTHGVKQERAHEQCWHKHIFCQVLRDKEGRSVETDLDLNRSYSVQQ